MGKTTGKVSAYNLPFTVGSWWIMVVCRCWSLWVNSSWSDKFHLLLVDVRSWSVYSFFPSTMGFCNWTHKQHLNGDQGTPQRCLLFISGKYVCNLRFSDKIILFLTFRILSAWGNSQLLWWQFNDRNRLSQRSSHLWFCGSNLPTDHPTQQVPVWAVPTVPFKWSSNVCTAEGSTLKVSWGQRALRIEIMEKMMGYDEYQVYWCQ